MKERPVSLSLSFTAIDNDHCVNELPTVLTEQRESGASLPVLLSSEVLVHGSAHGGGGEGGAKVVTT